MQYEYARVPVLRKAMVMETALPEPPKRDRSEKPTNKFPMFKVECLECEKVFSTQSLKCTCPNCGGHDVKPKGDA